MMKQLLMMYTEAEVGTIHFVEAVNYTSTVEQPIQTIPH